MMLNGYGTNQPPGKPNAARSCDSPLLHKESARMAMPNDFHF